MTLLILLSLKITTATADTETYLCYGKEETYNCRKYYGRDPNVYDYTENRGKHSINVHEFSDAGTRNPYAPSDNEPGSVEENKEQTPEIPVFIPYNPNILFQIFDQKK